MEIQGLWQVMPPSVVGAVKLRIRHASPLQSVASSGAGAHFAEDEATTSATAGGDEEDADLKLDDQHLAFTAHFLRHATPHLEPLYQAWRKCRSEQISSSRHRPALPQVKKKRQTPSVMTTESLALMQALAANTAAPLALPVPPTSNLSSFSLSSPIIGNIAASVDNPVALSVVLPPPPAPHPISAATPTKARRSASASIAPETPPTPIKTAKTPRKPLSSAALTAMNKLDSSANTLKAVKSPSKSISSSAAEHRTRTTSFESLSPGGVQPVASSPPYTPSKFHGERPSPDSATNSITTSGRSSPAGGLFGSKNRQRSLSDLNNPLSLRQPSTSPSPHKFAAGSPAAGLLATPGKLGECGLPGSDSSDILERCDLIMSSLSVISLFMICITHTKL